jgi:hypothetical protein
MSNPYVSPEVDSSRVSTGSEGVSELTMEAFRGTKKWVRLVGIVLLIMAALTAFGGLAVTFGFGFAGGRGIYSGSGVGLSIAMGAVYLVGAAIYCGLGAYLINYSNTIARLLEDGQVSSLDNVLQQQQKIWRATGVIAALSLLSMVIGMATTMFTLLTKF